jgi:hypothetical protein
MAVPRGLAPEAKDLVTSLSDQASSPGRELIHGPSTVLMPHDQAIAMQPGEGHPRGGRPDTEVPEECYKPARPDAVVVMQQVVTENREEQLVGGRLRDVIRQHRRSPSLPSRWRIERLGLAQVPAEMHPSLFTWPLSFES